MQTDQKVLNAVIKRFPEQTYDLTKLFYYDQDFKEVCEDYFLCKEAIDKIIITNTRKSKLLKDYKRTLKELETEMLMYLDTNLKTYGN